MPTPACVIYIRYNLTLCWIKPASVWYLWYNAALVLDSRVDSINPSYLGKWLRDLSYMYKAETQNKSKPLRVITGISRFWRWSLFFPRAFYMQFTTVTMRSRNRRWHCSVDDLFLDYQSLRNGRRPLFSHRKATHIHNLDDKKAGRVFDSIIVVCALRYVFCSCVLHESPWMQHQLQHYRCYLDLHVWIRSLCLVQITKVTEQSRQRALSQQWWPFSLPVMLSKCTALYVTLPRCVKLQMISSE